MFNYRKRDIENKAKECNFITNTTEKVLGLLGILEFIHSCIKGIFKYLLVYNALESKKTAFQIS